MKQVNLSLHEYFELLKGFQSKKPSPFPILKTRPFLNDEVSMFLLKDKRFLDEVRDIREKLKIPHLNVRKDQRDVNLGDESFSESYWMKNKGEQYIKPLYDKVDYIIQSFNLPIDFQEWILRYILYGYHKYSAITINIQYKTILEILNNPNEILRIPLTTEEKNFIKYIIRTKLNIKSRPSKETADIYKEIIQLLNQSKNTRRRAKTTKLATKTLDLKTNEGYDSLIPKLYSEKEEFTIGAPIIKNRLRQIKHRLLKRMPQTNPQN